MFCAMRRTSASLIARTRAFASSGETPSDWSCFTTSGRSRKARSFSRSAFGLAGSMEAAASSVPTSSAYAVPQHSANPTSEAPKKRERLR